MANCGSNELLAALEQAQDELAAKLAEGKGALADIQAKIKEAQETLANIKLPSIPIKESLQEGLEKLRSAIGPERDALMADLKEKFGDAVDNLDDLMTAMRNPFEELQFQAKLLEAQEELTRLLTSGASADLIAAAQERLAGFQAFDISICDDVPNVKFDPATGKALEEAAESLKATLEPMAEEMHEVLIESDAVRRLQQLVETGIPSAAQSPAGRVPSTQVLPGNTSVPEEQRTLPSINEEVPSVNADELPSASPSVPAGDGFTIAQLSSNAVVTKNAIRAQCGLSVEQITANLNALNTQVLRYIKAQYPNMIVTSGFRAGNGRSQHYRGMAADMQFPGTSNADYDQIAEWIRTNLRYDQLILEYKTTGTRLPWIHVSYNPQAANGFGRQMVMTFLNHSRTNNGLRDLSAIV